MADEKKYEINIDPRILELLGPSLYTNIYYILAELIANAYDANANNVYIIQDGNGSVIIEDDGAGMSYDEGDVAKYLNVAHETRVSSHDAYVKGSQNKRKKMGRKGVGKLAALSVSENVEIHTRKSGEKSGFVLSRHVEEDKMLVAIPDTEIRFQKVEGDGTSIVMTNPQYTLHVGLDVIAKNIIKIFPMVDNDFKIHIYRNGKKRVIDAFEKEIIQSLGGLIIYGDNFKHLKNLFNSQLIKRNELDKHLVSVLEPHTKSLKMKNKEGKEQNYELEIEGWVGVYRSTRGRKEMANDFPDNFLSILSNKKLGEFNILPTVGKNALSEVYIVGQLHVDLLEETTLPDMALSNRQGYKTDDPRYAEVVSFARELLLKITALRTRYATYVKEQKEGDKQVKDKEREDTLKQQIDKFTEHASNSAAKKINLSALGGNNLDLQTIADAVKQAINANLPDMGIKKKIDDIKRKILLSHTGADKVACDFVYDLLIFNNVPASHIIYTNCDNAESRIPHKIPQIPIFDYLKEFFVESYSTEKIYVLYVTSEDMSKSWGAVAEVGAGWITKSNHEIFSINGFVPNQPLNVGCEWANIKQDLNRIELIYREADKVADKIRTLCEYLGYTPKLKDENLLEIERIATVIKDV